MRVRYWVGPLLAVLSGLMLFESQSTGLHWLGPLALAPLYLAMTHLRDLRVLPSVVLPALTQVVVGAQFWGIAYFGSLLFNLLLGSFALTGATLGLLYTPLAKTLGERWKAVGFAAAWALTDFTRWSTITGLPAVQGSAASETPVLNQLAAVGGPTLVAFVYALFAAWSADALVAYLRGRKEGLRPALFAALLAASVLTYGAVRLAGAPRGPIESSEAVKKVPEGFRTGVVVQGSVPRWLHLSSWRYESLKRPIVWTYQRELKEAIAARPFGQAPEWIVMPESAFGWMFPPGAKGREAFVELFSEPWDPRTTVVAAMSHQTLHKDADRPRGAHYDSAFSLAWPEGASRPVILDELPKRHLTAWAESKFLPGTKHAPLKGVRSDADLGLYICSESGYPYLADGIGDAKAIAVIANNSGQGWANFPMTHARISITRAIESGRPMMHAGQSGPSFIVDAWGRKTRSLGLWEHGHVAAAFYAEPVPTLYMQTRPYWVPLVALIWSLLAFSGVLGWWRRRRVSGKNHPEDGERDPFFQGKSPQK